MHVLKMSTLQIAIFITFSLFIFNLLTAGPDYIYIFLSFISTLKPAFEHSR